MLLGSSTVLGIGTACDAFTSKDEKRHEMDTGAPGDGRGHGHDHGQV